MLDQGLAALSESIDAESGAEISEDGDDIDVSDDASMAELDSDEFISDEEQIDSEAESDGSIGESGQEFDDHSDNNSDVLEADADAAGDDTRVREDAFFSLKDMEKFADRGFDDQSEDDGIDYMKGKSLNHICSHT